MKRTLVYLGLAATLGFAAAAAAQATGNEVQRNLDQQARIGQGLKSGQLSTREAARLEHGEARINRIEGNAMKDGSVSATEAARIGHAQNVESARIYRQKHDAQHGNPASTSSKRMQADVQRNANQQARIKSGVASGSLTTTEAAGLERGQAHVERKEFRAGADGHVGVAGEAGIQHAENVQSARIYRRKHN